MTGILHLVRYGLRDVVRSRWLLLYCGFLFLLTYVLFQLTGDEDKVLVSLTSITLLLVPLIAVLFASFSISHAEDFLRFLLAQPLSRKVIYHGFYWGMTLPLVAAYVCGVGFPLLLYGTRTANALVLLGLSASLTVVSAGGACWIGFSMEDRTKAFGLSLALWLAMAVLFDGFVLVLAFVFRDYPLEGPLIAAMFLNPLDLARVVMLLRLDIAALMGYTGAVFQRFLGGSLGAAMAFSGLCAWCVGLYLLGMRAFCRRDF